MPNINSNSDSDDEIPHIIKRIFSGMMATILVWFSLPQIIFWYNVGSKIDGNFEGSWIDTAGPLVVQGIILLITIVIICFLAGVALGISATENIGGGIIVGIVLAVIIPAILVGIVLFFSIPFINAARLLDGDEEITAGQVGGWMIGFGIAAIMLSGLSLCGVACGSQESSDESDEDDEFKNLKTLYGVPTTFLLGLGLILLGSRVKAAMNHELEPMSAVYMITPWLITSLITAIYKATGGFIKSGYKGIVASEEYGSVSGVVTFIVHNILNILTTTWAIFGLIGYLTLAKWIDTPESYTGFQVVWWHFPVHILILSVAAIFMIYAILPEAICSSCIEISMGSDNDVEGQATTPHAPSWFDQLFGSMMPAVITSQSSRLENLLWDPTPGNSAVGTATTGTTDPPTAQAAQPTPPLQLQHDPNGRKEVVDRVAKEGELTCAVCLENVRNTVFIPCQHQAACFECAKKCTKCPVCRREGVKILPVYN